MVCLQFSPTQRRAKHAVAGAPELVNQATARMNPVTQTVDVWSFGAVLLVAATWVVLGQKGILEFQVFRMLSLSKMRSARTGGATTSELQHVDSFHDGERVLLGVREWIRRLNDHTRASDHVTDKLLTLIQDFVLVDKSYRIS